MNTKLLLLFFSLAFSFGVLTTTQQAAAQGADPIPEDTQAACNYAGGTCSVRDGNCNALAASTGQQYDLLGYCADMPSASLPASCCRRRTQTSGTGSDYYCTTTLSGNCRPASQGCGTGATNVGACQTDAAGTTRICCRNNPPTTAPAPGTLPGSATGPIMEDYQLLEQIPGSSNTVGRLNTYLQDIYTFAFWAVGIAVVFMLTIGGFMYLTSAGNTSRLTTAKTVIFDAFLGLVLALVAWLFLNVINPDLVNVRLPSASITPAETPAAPMVTTGGSSQTLAQQLQAGSPGVSLSGSGSCSSSAGAVSPASNIAQAAASTPVTACQAGCPGSGLCNNSTGFSDAMLRGLINVGARYPFTVSSLAGGSHGSGSAHYAGRAADVVPSAPRAQWPAIQSAFRAQGATLVICDITVSGRTTNVNCDDSRADHIHAQW